MCKQVHRIENVTDSNCAEIYSENAKVTITACILILASGYVFKNLSSFSSKALF